MTGALLGALLLASGAAAPAGSSVSPVAQGRQFDLSACLEKSSCRRVFLKISGRI